MARYDFRTSRLYVAAELAAGSGLVLSREQTNYLKNVLRLEPDAEILVFNGRDGEWRARLMLSKREARLAVEEKLRPQPEPKDLALAFAPLKHARLDYMVQKAVEMGTTRLEPVITRHTQVSRVNVARMRANAIEAAEQCGILRVPDVDEPIDLARFLGALAPERVLVFCDEDAETADPIKALSSAPDGPFTLLIGPEGGFAEEERRALIARGRVVRFSLGPRILRADTAAVAALAILQAVRGDWR